MKCSIEGCKQDACSLQAIYNNDDVLVRLEGRCVIHAFPTRAESRQQKKQKMMER